MIKKSKQEGQVLLLTVLLLSGAILSATTLAAIMVLYQLRQSADTSGSAKAIYAADSGIECTLFNKFRCTAISPNCPSITTVARDCGDINPVTLNNGAVYKTVVSGGGNVVTSIGKSGRAARAFEITF